MWVDAPNATGNDSYPGTDSWKIQKNSDGSYTFKNAWYSNDYTFGISEFYKGIAGDTRVYICDKEEVYYVEEEAYPSFQDPSMTNGCLLTLRNMKVFNQKY